MAPRTSSSWIAELGRIRDVQAELMRRSPFRDACLIPNPSAGVEQVSAAEKRLGLALPASYQEFLLQHNGWPRFYEGATLLGAEDLGKPTYAELADAALSAAETPHPDECPPSRLRGRPRQILVFGIDPAATTLFAFNPRHRRTDGEMEVVAWVHELGLSCPTFPDFLRLIREVCEEELHTFGSESLSHGPAGHANGTAAAASA